MTALPKVIADYSTAFHTGERATLPATSPLGAWLLLALLAPSASGESREKISSALGVDPVTAANTARQLLAEPHPAVATALGVWRRDHLVKEEFFSWAATLPDSVERGGEPHQPLLDEWARRNTREMIKEFPATITEDTALVFASALAAEGSWREPYRVANAAALGGSFGESGHACLTVSGSAQNFIARTKAAGLVAVHENVSTEGIAVMSVLAGASVSADRVHAAAAEVLTARSEGRKKDLVVRLSELPLGTGEAWEITERRGSHDFMYSVLPAWRAEAKPFNAAEAPGVDAGIDTMKKMLFPGAEVTAKQAVFAEYTAKGFRAAAVTALVSLDIGAARLLLTDNSIRVAVARFNRPYAVVAYCAPIPGRVSRWDNVSLFSAWVSSSVDAAEPSGSIWPTRR